MRFSLENAKPVPPGLRLSVRTPARAYFRVNKATGGGFFGRFSRCKLSYL